MTAVFFDSTHSDEERRERLYQGDIYVYSPTPASRGLCDLANRLSEEAFAPHPPEVSQKHFSVEEYAGILSKLKPSFIHHPESKEWIRKIFKEFNCNPEHTYFDVPRLRSSTSDGYLTTGIAYAFHPHRDTWYSAPNSQINWWMPVRAQQAGNVMAFHTAYFDSEVPNTSSNYDYYRWNQNSRRDAAKHIGKDTREQPKATVEIDNSDDLRIVAPVGGLMLFSGAHLHSSVENLTGQTRFSIDFRTVNVNDANANIGAPIRDSACTGTTLRDFLQGADLSKLDETTVAVHDSGDGDGDFVYDPNAS